MDIKKFGELPIIGILRGIKAEDIFPLSETIIASGLKTIEITMNTEGAAERIREMVKYSAGRLTIELVPFPIGMLKI